MHPELQHLLVLLAVARLLVLAATPAPAPWAGTLGAPAGRRLTDWRAAARPPRPRAGSPDRPEPARPGSPAPVRPIAAAGGGRAPNRTRRGRRGCQRPRGAAAGVKWRTGPRNGHLYVAALNTQSLKPHLLELRQDISEHGYDIAALSETWLKPSTPNRLIPIPGYTIYRNDRADGRGYGGVAVLVRDGLEATVLGDMGRPVEGTGLESLWVRVRTGAQRVAVCSLYRPPERAAARVAADLDEVERQIQHVLANHSGPVVLAGDVNVNLASAGDGVAARRLRELLDTYGLRRHVRGPTFGPAGSAIDIMCSSTDAARAGTLSCDFSPHRWLRALISVPEYRPPQCSITARCWGKFDVTEANRRLQSVDWEPVFTSAEPAAQWDYFVSRALPVLDSLAPLKRIKIRNPTAPPVTDATQLLMAQRRSCLRDGDRDRYRELNRQVKSAIRRDSRQDIQRRIQEGGSGNMWRSIRSVISGKRTARPSPTANPDDMNRYFANIGTQIAGQVDSSGPELPVRLPRVTSGGFVVQTVTPERLASTVAGMSNSAASGADGLSVRFIKMCLPSLSHVLTHIVNSSLASHTVPRSWKMTLIHPIQKNPKSTDTSNYRPIAILPTIAKITERIVYEQLYSYLSVHHLLSSCQHGFRTNHSTETALLTMTDRILEAMDRKQVALLCMLDLSKCFDVIPHDRLLVKLEQYGVDTRWFTSYLDDHYQQVVIRSPDGRSTLSQPLANTIGTYQGSALGPLLFSVYANDMPLFQPDDDSHATCLVQYCDDTQLAVLGSPRDAGALVACMEHNLAALGDWLRKNGLKVNADKTQLMVVGTRQNVRQLPAISVQFMNATMVPSPTAKNLGVTFDAALSFDVHVSDVVRRCTGVLSGLCHSRHCLPRDTLVTLVQALAVSAVRYAISVYGVCGITQMRRLQRLLNFGARIVSGRRKFDHISDVMRDLQWLSAENMWRFQSVMLLKKMLTTGQPESLRDRVTSRCGLHGRSTRQADHLQVPMIRTEAGRRRFLYSAVDMFNRLPASVRDLNLLRFKKEYRARLLREQYGDD